MHWMMLNAPRVINGALLRVRMANQVCIWDQRQFGMSGAVRAVFCRVGAIATLAMIRTLGRWHIVPEMKGISGPGRGSRLCCTGAVVRRVVAVSLLARLCMRILRSVWMRLVQVTLRLAGIGMACGAVIVGKLLGSCGTGFRSVIRLSMMGVVPGRALLVLMLSGRCTVFRTMQITLRLSTSGIALRRAELGMLVAGCCILLRSVRFSLA